MPKLYFLVLGRFDFGLEPPSPPGLLLALDEDPPGLLESGLDVLVRNCLDFLGKTKFGHRHARTCNVLRSEPHFLLFGSGTTGPQWPGSCIMHLVTEFTLSPWHKSHLFHSLMGQVPPPEFQWAECYVFYNIWQASTTHEFFLGPRRNIIVGILPFSHGIGQHIVFLLKLRDMLFKLIDVPERENMEKGKDGENLLCQ